MRARGVVEARYAAHWRTDRGFSVDTLIARRAWFTPTLFDLMRADMRDGTKVGLAMLPAGATWQIGDFVTAQGSLAKMLRSQSPAPVDSMHR